MAKRKARAAPPPPAPEKIAPTDNEALHALAQEIAGMINERIIGRDAKLAFIRAFFATTVANACMPPMPYPYRDGFIDRLNRFVTGEVLQHNVNVRVQQEARAKEKKEPRRGK